ncbi:hypothetical protein [Streptomyces sp. NPDC005805]|uniref:hypothetical protein n=1 Tax=Streptomyces sp. NPDC005805 TaxID=3157068 RepID=UPI0033E4AD3B
MLLHTLVPVPAQPAGPPRAVPVTRPAGPGPVEAPADVVAAGVVAAPGAVERAAAFDLQVELVTRVGVQPLAAEEGSLREALTSLYSLFGTSRDVLHRMAGETAGPLVLPGVAASLANQHLRPFLATWHPALQEHEAARPPETGAAEHERQWKRAGEMRTALAGLRAPLTAAAERLATLCGIDLLSSSQADHRGAEDHGGGPPDDH